MTTENSEKGFIDDIKARYIRPACVTSEASEQMDQLLQKIGDPALEGVIRQLDTANGVSTITDETFSDAVLDLSFVHGQEGVLKLIQDPTGVYNENELKLLQKIQEDDELQIIWGYDVQDILHPIDFNPID